MRGANMTYRDIAILAEEIRNIDSLHERVAAANAVSAACRRSNWQFHPNKFYKACGFTKKFRETYNITFVAR
jgi:hypothetical protein